jgi:organic hydroperoxide reductase OsmC/OhrA
MTTFLAIAENSHLEFTDFSCKSKGRLEKVEGKFMMTEVELTAYVTILREKDTEKAERVLRKSEEVCLISNSIKSKVTMSPIIMLSEPQASTSLVQ